MDEKKEIIFILPYLNVNTTSAERFKSLIKAFEKNKNCKLSIIIIKYPSKKSFFPGFDLNNDFLNNINNNLFYYTPKLNFIQRLGFYFLEKDKIKLWKLCKLFQLIFFHSDIFNPGKLKIILPQNLENKGIVICSGGPFSLFYSTYIYSKKLGYKLILDYRDPQTFGYVPLDGFNLIYKLRILLERRKEIIVLKNANIITTVSKSLRSLFPIKYQKKIKVFPNGSNFDDNDVVQNTSNNVFNLVYAGTIYSQQLEEDKFFKAFEKFISDKKSSKIKLQFLGSIESKGLIEKIKEFNLDSVTEITPRLKNIELLKNLNNASVFVHLRYGERKEVISSKQAEYLLFRRPILLPISDNGDIAESIMKHKAGYVCESESQIFETLEMLWGKFIKGENLFINQSQEFIESISRKKIAKDFVKLLMEN